MPLSPGARLGPYEVVALLGEGGMGAVYRAHDARLGRDVAIKVLREEVTGDSDRRQRFVQEAKAASGLNHPNVVTVHDIGTEGDAVYMVMELVDGRPLDALIPAGGFSPAEVLRIGAQVADACSAAHARQIVHRDLKPANVMLQADGRAKVLDFGLAKIVESTALEKSVTQTAAGTVLGTAAYMSPEQAQGKILDARTDVFSLGAVLYELATGSRAFQGESHATVIAELLKEDPRSPELLRSDIPAELGRLIMRCLRKDPSRRVQSMADLRASLEELRDELASGRLPSGTIAAQTVSRAIEPRTSGTRWRFAAIGAGVVILALAGILAWQSFDTPAAPAEAVLHPVPFTSFEGTERAGSFSPDGNQVAFVWNGDKQDNSDIYVKLIGPGTPLRLTSDPAFDDEPRWSPDGRFIAFFRGTEPRSRTLSLMLVPSLGGSERKLGEFYPRVAIMPLMDLAWTSDSRYLLVASGRVQGEPSNIQRVSVETGEIKTLMTVAAASDGYQSLDVSPDGRRLAAVRDNLGTEEIELFDLSPASELSGSQGLSGVGGAAMRARWTADSRDLILQPSVNNPMALYRLTVSTKNLVPLNWMGPGASSPTISGAAGRMVFTRDFRDTNLWRVALDAGGSAPVMDKVAVSSFREVAPHYSPDGKRLAFHSNRGGSVQIWASNADGSNPVQLTSLDPMATTGTPRWSPDSQRILFDSNAGGGYHMYIVPGDGGQPRAITSGPTRNFIGWWSPDGNWIYFTTDRSGVQLNIWRMRTDGTSPEQVTRNGAEAPSISPDGQWLYFTKEEGVEGLWRMPVAGGAETRVVDAIFRYNYAATNRGVYYVATPSPKDMTSIVRFLDLATGKTSDIAPIDRRVDLGLAVSPDGKYLLFTKIDYLGADLMLVEKFR